MSHKTVGAIKSLKEIEEIISHAITKVRARRENDICHYIPMTSGGYMHHLTLKRMKKQQPDELGAMIEQFIINKESPGRVTPKNRAARGSRKRRDHITFTRNQLERMLEIARGVGDSEMVNVLSPKRSLALCKRELIASIRHSRVEPDIWNAYIEAVANQQKFVEEAALKG
jgi:hypothetical protein